MALNNIFATQPTGNVPASYLDANFNAVGAMAITQCTASGTNSITLTPITNQPAVPAYANYQLFSFVPANSPTGSVSIQVGSLSSLPLYLQNGSTQAGSGAFSTTQLLIIAYNSALNSGAGGFQIVSSINTGSGLVNVQEFISGGTYTPSVGANSAIIFCIGSGGGGGGSGTTTSGGSGGAGNTTSVGSICVATGGGGGLANGGGTPNVSGSGGTTSGGTGSVIKLPGSAGFPSQPQSGAIGNIGGSGGPGIFGTGAGQGGSQGANGGAGGSNTGAGGAGAGGLGASGFTGGSGGGAGALSISYVTTLTGTYAVTIGVGGIAGTAGTSGFTGGTGGTGFALILEF